ncbi:MAG: high-affinity iron transporter [Promethearchaeia archaeon]|nr:MAG: high-affinity iron transporter [Candidatus Lokiarchaeia archaeon]
MIVSFIITLRETLEIALIIAIIFRYLRKSNQIEFTKYAIWGIITGLMLSIFGGLLITFLSILFEGKTEQIFEGIIMLIGAILLTTMILWMINQKNISEELERKIQTETNKTHKFGIFFLIMTSILREGIEIVLFLSAARFSDESNSLLGATFGIIVAIILGIILYQGTSKINLKLFFNLTSIFLIIISAGLFSYSLHEFQEAGIIPIIIEHFYDINFIIDEKGIFGSFLKGLFGYNGNPSLLEMITYIFYILIVFTIWKFLKKEPSQNQKNILKKESNLLIN